MNTTNQTSGRRLLYGLLGILLALAGIALLLLTERGLMHYRLVAERHGGQVIDLGADAGPQVGEHGSMVRLTGTPRVVEAPHDPQFNQRADTPVLVRHVQMFQWREVRVGSSVHYEMDWEARPLDSSRFRQPQGHTNPGAFPLQGDRFAARQVQLGGFTLSPVLVRALPGSQPVTPDMKSLPVNLAASFSRHQDFLVTSAHPGDPRLGDVRVSWSEVPLQNVTIVARVDGNRLVPATGTADGRGYDVAVGELPLAGLFPDMPASPGMLWVRRVLAVLLMALGASLLLPLWRRGERDALLALAAGAVLAGVVAGVSWLGGGVVMVAGWFGLMLLGIVLAVWRLRVR